MKLTPASVIRVACTLKNVTLNNYVVCLITHFFDVLLYTYYVKSYAVEFTIVQANMLIMS